MYQFDTPFYFYFFGVLPVLWLGFYLVIRWKRKAQLQFTDANLMKKLSPYRSRFKPGFKLQAEEFYKHVAKKKIYDMKLAKLDDAIRALKIADEATK